MMTTRLTALISTAIVFLGVSALASADNPVHWDFTEVTTFGADVSWTSPTAIDDGPLFNYSYEITLIEAYVGTLGTYWWTDVTSLFPPEDLSDNGSVPGPLPVDIYSDHVVYPDPPETPELEADMHIYLDAAGYGKVDVSNLTLGSILGLDLAGIRATGYIDAEMIPEPISLVLLGGGVLGLLARRRRQK